MKKDIEIHKVEDIAVVIVPDAENPNAEIWDVFILNLKNKAINNVLINSRGYGELDGKKVETTVFRYFFERIEAKSFEKIELIKSQVFGIANEYWVSFSLDNHLYDKRYIFVKGSIDPSNFTPLPLLEKRGVMIK